MVRLDVRWYGRKVEKGLGLKSCECDGIDDIFVVGIYDIYLFIFWGNWVLILKIFNGFFYNLKVFKIW